MTKSTVTDTHPLIRASDPISNEMKETPLDSKDLNDRGSKYDLLQHFGIALDQPKVNLRRNIKSISLYRNRTFLGNQDTFDI